MTHDPMCPFAPWPDERCYQPDAGVSICSIIAKVREDERDNAWSSVAEIPAIELWDGVKTAWWIVKADALAAITRTELRALQEKP